jgi:hypothetical protein
LGKGRIERVNPSQPLNSTLFTGNNLAKTLGYGFMRQPPSVIDQAPVTTFRQSEKTVLKRSIVKKPTNTPEPDWLKLY